MPNRSLHEGQVFGNYRLVRLLGRGGFAEVYLARHLHIRRMAAIKLLLAQVDEHDIKRFKREAQIVSDLHHPHIISLLDFGVHNEHNEHIPYLVMEYAASGTLRQRHPRGSILSPTEALTYMSQVAEALDFAHNRSIIHRDVKPENMLLNTQDTLLLSDFGIATLTSEFGAQVTPSVAGTATYMAPEQLRGKTRPESDQYALAVVLYEWLCGETPFHGTYPEIAVQHINAPPPSLRTRNPRISPTVEEVVNIALSKDPGQRYPTVTEFVEDLRLALRPARHVQNLSSARSLQEPRRPKTQSNSPVSVPTQRASASPMNSIPSYPTKRHSIQSARQDDIPQRATSVSRRAILLTLGSFAVLGSVGGGIAWFTRQQPNGSLSRQTTPVTTSGAASRQSGRNLGKKGATPSATNASTPIPEGTILNTYKGHNSIVYSVAWSPSGKRIVSGSADHTAQIWDAFTGNNPLSYALHTDVVYSVAWSPDDKYIASGSWDRSAHVWEAQTGNLVRAYRNHQGSVFTASWSFNGTYIASGSADSTIHIWEALTGKVLNIFSKHSGPVYAASWSQDSTLIASGSSDKNVLVWRVNTGDVLIKYFGHTDVVYTVQWSPDGQYIASAGNDDTIHVWNASNAKLIYKYNKHQGAIFAVAWSPDGKRIASASADGSAHVWGAFDGSNVFVYPGHKGFVHTVAWKDHYIASSGADKTVQIWEAM